MIGRKGGSADAVFHGANTRIGDVSSPTNELNLIQYCELFEEAARQTRDPNFGLQFGAQFHPKKLGPLGYAAISSPTLGAAIQNMETYFPAHQESSRFSLTGDGSVLWLSYQIVDPRITRRRQDAELSLGMFCNVFRHALGEDWSPLEVRFEHTQMEAAAHSHHFGAPVRFGHHTNALAFRRDALSTPMVERDPYLYAILEAMLKSRCALQDSPQDLVSILRSQIRMNLGNRTPTLSDIARALGQGPAILQRRLRRIGLTYNDVLRSTRQELALHYLKTSDMPLTEVALCLGYSELSAFSRAFQNWTRMSPHRFRKLARAVED
ncbi:MAG: AraC family transcriptional regulator [Rhizobiaceae bacterium]|nr:AraC family transcriptional regulator [Rhizobiaceae bacterium]